MSSPVNCICSSIARYSLISVKRWYWNACIDQGRFEGVEPEGVRSSTKLPVEVRRRTAPSAGSANSIVFLRRRKGDTIKLSGVLRFHLDHSIRYWNTWSDDGFIGDAWRQMRFAIAMPNFGSRARIQPQPAVCKWATAAVRLQLPAGRQRFIDGDLTEQIINVVNWLAR